ncbi:DUF2303 family protein [Budviciaceae bacterium BWR-B9]|uniref:DUF2303 family protein n=1 Tax=Limnobaculum allomyrinae TaxID=2791986 RepID=A0ABS1ISL9_9GAMM|nr:MULTISPECIES: DUF2303 family protein [Limnobaculum]MBK5144677.1 DUF2303 family protein [Limnobaculum allomyrinae]MBV7694082.1 YfdQ family protein [Limnobaculum sp. M2-1]
MTQLDASAIKEVRDLALAEHLTHDLSETTFSAVVLPEGYRIQRLEHLNEMRDRFRGCMNTTSIDDFVRYSIQNAMFESNPAGCFINADAMEAVSIFNIGSIIEPGHADNTASIALKKTAPFRALLDINGRKNRQKDLAEWLEDWRDYLLAFDAEGNEMIIKQAVSAIRRISIEAMSTSDHEDQDFSAKRSVMESVEAKSKETMPVAFEFKCVPYEGLTDRRFSLRLSILASDTPQLVLRIIQLETAEEAIATEFRDLLIEKFTDKPVNTFIGSFKA